MNNGYGRKRPPPPAQQPSLANPPAKIQATSQEDEFLDEDVFLEESLLHEDEEYLILRDLEERQGLADRLAKWGRPRLSDEYVSQSRNIGQL